MILDIDKYLIFTTFPTRFKCVGPKTDWLRLTTTIAPKGRLYGSNVKVITSLSLPFENVSQNCVNIAFSMGLPQSAETTVMPTCRVCDPGLRLFMLTHR